MATALDTVIVGSSTTGLSCMRLASQAGARAYGACDKGSWPTRTRHYHELPAGKDGIWRGQLGEEGNAYLEQLPFASAVLIPATDDSALWMSSLPSSLTDRFRVSSSSRDTLERLQDKAAFAELTGELKVPAPYSRSIASEADLEQIPFDEFDALFLKPVDSQEFFRKYNEKAFWVEGKSDAIETWLKVHSDGLGLIAQEYVSGSAADHYFIDGFRDGAGQICAKTARRRLRIYPIDFGNSSYCESIPFSVVEEAWDGLQRILDHVSYRGIFSAEFKRDKKSGVFKILEINTRPWVYVEFAGVCGMNMCDLYMQDAVDGRAQVIEGYKAGLGCVNLYHDIVAVIEMPGEQRPAAGSLLWCWLRSFKLLYSFRDPWPALVFLTGVIRSKVRRLLSNRK